MDSETAASAAEALMDVRRSGRQIEALPADCMPQTLEDAYAIQRAYVPQVAQFTDGRRVGYKAGATAEAPQKMLGLEEPFHGVLLSSTVHKNGAVIPSGTCFMRVAECEFAFRLADNLPSSAGPYDLDAVRAAVGSVILSIEIVDLRLSGGLQAGGLQVIADNGGAGLWIEGREIEDFDSIDLDDWPVNLVVNAEVLHEGNAAAVMGNPLNSLAWLANKLCQTGLGLKTGDIVTAGSCTPLTPVAEGDEVVADFGSLGQVSVRFDR
jgi:2-keto-4-pentenoate hydratase